jgi:hypothetical protein
MCDIHVGREEPGDGAFMNSSSTVDFSNDGAFAESILSIMWPKTAAGAGSFWNYARGNQSVDNSAHYAAYQAHAKRLVARNITSCPQGPACPGRSCDVTTKCGHKYNATSKTK